MPVQPLILAAGKGTRMRSKKPKVLQDLGGKPMLAHVIDSVKALDSCEQPIVVIGFGADQVKAAMGDNLEYVEQSEQLGTGHAVQMASDAILDDAVVVVLYGDVPFISPDTIAQVVSNADFGTLSLLTVFMDDPTGYGRILRGESSKVLEIVEQKDANEDQLKIREVNTGVLAFKGDLLKSIVAQLSNDNAQSEYYLTDIVSMAVDRNIPIKTCQPKEPREVLGANDRKQLAALEANLRKRKVEALFDQGVSLNTPETVDIRGDLNVGQDVVIENNVIFLGSVTLGDDVVIEPNCIIKDTVVQSGSQIRAFSHLEGAEVGEQAVIGPYARLRSGSKIGRQAKVGNFVETKNISLGEGSKANHLTYLGDSQIGQSVNIGAGTITCNYDGKNKHQTVIQDDVFIGSNSALIAPVTVGKGATVAAGTTVAKDVSDQELCVARASQRAIKNWRRPDQQSDD